MRFVFVDRLLAIDPGRRIEVLKNVSATEDIFDDHFPGCPVFPGALTIEVFEQAAQLLIFETHGGARVGRLERLARSTFRQLVRPGDQLHARCERRGTGETRWTVAASATVDGRTVADAVLELSLADPGATGETREQAARLGALLRVLRQTPFAIAGVGATA